jgi:demethylmenaquinone methyltransferase/2-methoxy-6-polyprenyl-1,4-benzoquinol methylase
VDDVLNEQLAYYRARAREYDESVRGIGASSAAVPEYEEANREWLQIVHALRVLTLVDDVLELACGTGIWTQELTNISHSIIAIDGSPEMIEINRTKHGSARVEYQCMDLFEWKPEKQYDLVFFAFWLSHVPPDRLSSFLGKVARATKPGGKVFIVDEPKSDRNISGPNVNSLYQHRTLQDGRSFRIVKAYYDPKKIERELLKRGFQNDSSMIGKSFFYLCAARPGSD